MGSLNGGPRVIPQPGALPGDEQFLSEAARLVVTTGRDRQSAQKFALMWVLILAMYEQTTPGHVLEKLYRSQPKRNDQYGLLRKLRARVEEAREA